jgi:hypothetical protein
MRRNEDNSFQSFQPFKSLTEAFGFGGIGRKERKKDFRNVGAGLKPALFLPA